MFWAYGLDNKSSSEPMTVSDCVGSMVSKWELKLKKAVGYVDIEMGSQFGVLAADVISHVAFRSDHRAANGVHLAHKELQFLAFSSIFYLLNRIP